MKTLFYTLLASVLFCSCSQSDSNASKLHNPNKESVPGEMQKITFTASDSLEVVANYYPVSNARKMILLFHMANSSKGEYKDIAPRLTEKGYACMAVDLRKGGPVFEILNETNINAIKLGKKMNEYDAMKDMEAAIAYAKSIWDGEIVLWGSSYSGTLALMVGKDDPRIGRVLAFSPGIHFGSRETIVSALSAYDKPVFVSCAKTEVEYVHGLVRVIPKKWLHFVEPRFLGQHGSGLFWDTNESTEEVFEHVIAFLP